jgi:uncharacterized protein YqfA (UPF0365 family)
VLVLFAEAAPMNDPNNLIFIMLLVFLLPIGFVALLALWALRPWLRATMLGTQLTVFEIIGMKLRGVNVDAVVAAMVMARQCDVEVHQVDLQRADRAGIDVEKLTFAWIAAQRRQMPITFEQLVVMYQEERLGDLLEGSLAEFETEQDVDEA